MTPGETEALLESYLEYNLNATLCVGNVVSGGYKRPTLLLIFFGEL